MTGSMGGPTWARVPGHLGGTRDMGFASLSLNGGGFSQVIGAPRNALFSGAFVLPTDGAYTVGFGALHTVANNGLSILVVDNVAQVPEIDGNSAAVPLMVLVFALFAAEEKPRKLSAA